MSYNQTDALQPIAALEPPQRAIFIRRTYLHLAGAIFIFMVLEAMLFSIPGIEYVLGAVFSWQYSWLVVLAAYMGVSYVADMWAHAETSVEMQYLGFGVFLLAEAIIFLPLLYIASTIAPSVIPTAAVMTLALFTGLTATVFINRIDFSFLGPILCIGGLIALGFIAASILFGFSLGLFFAAIMAIYAAGAILYSTSQVMLHYHTGQHVGAALSLFASLALLFWYVVQILLSLSGDD